MTRVQHLDGNKMMLQDDKQFARARYQTNVRTAPVRSEHVNIGSHRLIFTRRARLAPQRTLSRCIVIRAGSKVDIGLQPNFLGRKCTSGARPRRAPRGTPEQWGRNDGTRREPSTSSCEIDGPRGRRGGRPAHARLLALGFELAFQSRDPAFLRGEGSLLRPLSPSWPPSFSPPTVSSLRWRAPFVPLR
jgi:hypothetical protein